MNRAEVLVEVGPLSIAVHEDTKDDKTHQLAWSLGSATLEVEVVHRSETWSVLFRVYHYAAATLTDAKGNVAQWTTHPDDAWSDAPEHVKRYIKKNRHCSLFAERYEIEDEGLTTRISDYMTRGDFADYLAHGIEKLLSVIPDEILPCLQYAQCEMKPSFTL